MTAQNTAEWRRMALEAGWLVTTSELAHPELDRSWPLGDWEGACRDIGLDEEDLQKPIPSNS